MSSMLREDARLLDREEGFAAVRTLLLERGGVDISRYRPKCVFRRIAVRQRKLGMENLKEYAAVLRADPHEYARLLGTLTINVTEFFRDPSLFRLIARRILPDLFERKACRRRRKALLKFWCAGCASGEEAYSLAITLEEFRKTMRRAPDYKIYGTDVDRKALEIAKAGRYRPEQVKKMQPAYLEQYFLREGGAYRIAPSLAGKVKFMAHDITRPFPRVSGLDMILCRNVLIYLEKSAHRTVFSLLDRKLAVKGYLVLGKVERIDEHFSSRFPVVHLRERIYRKASGGAL